MISYSEFLKKLQSLSYKEIEQIALKAGVSFDTLISIKTGRTKSPRMSTVEAVSKYL